MSRDSMVIAVAIFAGAYFGIPALGRAVMCDEYVMVPAVITVEVIGETQTTHTEVRVCRNYTND